MHRKIIIEFRLQRQFPVRPAGLKPIAVLIQQQYLSLNLMVFSHIVQHKIYRCASCWYCVMDATDDDDDDNVACSDSLVRRIFDGFFFSCLFDFNCEIRSTEIPILLCTNTSRAMQSKQK